MAEYKIVISGPMGAGKTTALAAVSEIAPVSTDVENTRPDEADKATTTVAMDYGEVQLGDGDVLRLYGTPGQERFGFMRAILARGAIGLVLLIDAGRSDPAADLESFLESFEGGPKFLPLVIGVTKTDLADNLDALLTVLQGRLEALGFVAPCLCCDVRERAQVLILLNALLAVIESGLDPH